MERWEYLIITGTSVEGTSYPRAYRVMEQGLQVLTEFKERPRGTSELNAVMAYIANLGNEGWELVTAPFGVGDLNDKRWCFKRIKS
jgi:hypothetical protein